MAEYTPTIWECGDVVTAERLNHMEEGIEAANACCEGGGGSETLIVNVIATIDGNCQVYTLDHTWQEIRDAFPNVLLHSPLIGNDEAWASVSEFSIIESKYNVGFNGEYSFVYEADSADGYPAYRYCGGM